ncbi:MAG: DegT/DnrJ/EryC1/StrS family aminotransferase [Deltaproteobacteria bacterium]|nr:DegT/DnrJ/EryC1/StrS family aminotransferase [Deltaproteobacteria bacterium]
MNLNSDNKIIGGMFGLPETVEPKVATEPHQWKFIDDSNLLLANGRSGIMVLIDRLAPASVWMPSYLCPTMIEAVDQKKTNLRFYEVDYNLHILSTDWVDQIQTGDLVALIDYFGLPLSSKVAGLVKGHGGYILEDACQAFLSEHVGQYSDFVLFSPRKTIGVPDGGILVSCCNVKFDNIKLETAPLVWWLKMLEATINRREFDQYGGDRRWYRLFQETDAATPIGYFAMSDLSRKLLLNGFEYKKICRRRIENYSILAHNLEDIAMFPILPEGTIPLGFPIRHPRRDQIRINLFQEQIYPPVHWLIDGVMPMEFSESYRLAGQVMTLPCDQRYGSEDMHRMVSSVLKTLNNERGNLQ